LHFNTQYIEGKTFTLDSTRFTATKWIS